MPGKISRRIFLRIVYAVLSLLAINGLINCSETKPDHPNILLIINDDQGYADLSCSGLAKDVSTPNMDMLAANGIRFTQAYASSPICSPSRMSIITGIYNQRFGTYWYGGEGIHRAEFRTIAELLKTQNYKTGYVGKVHYGSNDDNIINRNFPNNHGFDFYFGHTSARKHYLNHKAQLEADFQRVKKEHNKWGQSLRQQPMWENKVQKDVEGFSTELFAQKACEFIKENKKHPFFLQLAFNAVHNFTHQLPEKYLKKHNLKGYHDWNPAIEDYYEWYQKGRYPNNPEGRVHYLAQLSYLDSSIGRVLDFLKTNKLYENTVVIVIGDNGGSTPIYADNGPLRGGKYTLYEGGIRVPMIVSWPKKFRKGVVADNVISGLDILPTICTATGTQIPENIDGMDLSKLLSGETKKLEHEVLFWDTGKQTAVRKGKWKLRTASDKKSQDYEMVELELGEFLYDIQKDASEQTNLINDYPEIASQLKILHRDWKNDIEKN